MRLLGLLLALCAAALGSPGLAADRTPAERQTLVELAYVLGQSHALRQACAGREDQFWRERMTRLVETEAPDAAFDARLRESFNAGYAAAQARYPTCGRESRGQEAQTAAHGRALASGMARAAADDEAAR